MYMLTLITDHNALIFTPFFSVIDTTVAGWVLELQHDYPGLTISHIAGVENSAADALSRNPIFLQQSNADNPVLPDPDQPENSCNNDLVGCVLSFQGESLDPVFATNLNSAPYTSGTWLYDKCDTQIDRFLPCLFSQVQPWCYPPMHN